jgi:cytochrome c-type biogenesis protein CcmE
MLFFNKSTSAAVAATLLALSVSACGGKSAQSATPSAIVASPSTYDGQSVSVSGTAKSPKARTTKRGQMLMFQLCDTQCINVVEFGDAAAAGVTEGQSVSVTGSFRASFGRVRHMENVVIVGGRPGGGGGGAAGGGGASPAATDAAASPDSAASPDATASP